MIKIDFNQSSYDTLPPVLRTIMNFSWVQVLIKPLKDNYNIFSGYTFDNNFEVNHSSQVMSFEDYLNTKVPSGYGGVNIINGTWLNYLYRWYQTEIDNYGGYGDIKKYIEYKNETELTETYLFYESEVNYDTIDFIVKYHSEDLVDNPDYLNELTTWIDKLRIIGTTYKFEEI